jgi:predicted ATPase
MGCRSCGTETQALLDGLIESLPTARVLLLVNYRPEYRHHWGGKSRYAQLRIDPLPPESAEELLGSILGHVPELKPLKRALIERTEGNPFFLEESVRTLVETGALVGERGTYHLAGERPEIRLPATVQAVLAARIDRLSPEDKRLLQAAAVVGKDVPLILLGAIAELPDDELHSGLARLQASEFLHQAALFPEPEYTFKHALTHEVAYAGLLKERRRVLHARIVEAIEHSYPDRLLEHVERLAHHAIRGEAWEKAAVYARQAGQRAVARSANHDAVAQFEQALIALGRLPQTREVVAQAIELQFDLRSPHFSLGERQRTLDCLRQAEVLATTIGDRRRLGWVACYMSNHFSIVGDRCRAAEAGGGSA